MKVLRHALTLLIADDDFLFRIPLYLAPNEHRDKDEMAGDGGVMRGFDRRDGRLS